jgi:hypothetical protein
MWSFIFSWAVVAIVGPGLVLLGFGVLSMNPPEVRIAQACFAVGYLLILTKVAWWVAFERTESLLQRTLFIVMLFAAVGILWFASHTLAATKSLKSSIPEPFSVEVHAAAVSDSGPITLFVMTLPSPTGTLVSPVFYLAYIQITNLQDVPNTIDRMSIAVSKELEGPYEDLIPMGLDISTHTLYVLSGGHASPPKTLNIYGTMRFAKPMTNDDLKSAAIVRAEPAIESGLANPIPPHAPIRGWIGLHSLRHVGLSPGQIYFRFKLFDVTKKESTYVAELPRSSIEDSSVQPGPGQLDVTGITVDLSGLPIKYFREP